MSVSAITKKWIRTKADERAVDQGCWFDPSGPERVRAFFATFLCHSKGQFAGKAFELLDWQWNDLVCPLFGWRRKDGFRRFRVAYVEIPKKNGKSTIAAGFGNYFLIADGEAGAEVYSTAVTRPQAGIVHKEAINMIKASPALRAAVHLNESTHEITFRRNGSKYKALASGADRNEGLNASAIIVDELHAWTGTAGRSFFEAIQYAGAARRQPMLFVITTAGKDLDTKCYELHQYARGILSGTNAEDTRFFAYIRGAEERDDPEAPETWRKANPSLGVTMTEEDFAADVVEAKKTPTAWRSFLRYRLNRWIGGTVAAISPEQWAACRRSIEAADLAGRRCWGGLDLARVGDMSAFSLVFEGDEPDEVFVKAWFWLPEDAVEDPTAPAEWKLWRDVGVLKCTPGNVTDYAIVEDDLVAILNEHRPTAFAYDPLFASDLTARVEERTGVERVEFPQRMVNFCGPTAEFERCVTAAKLGHDGNPCLTSQVLRVTWQMDPNGNKRPRKPGHAQRQKIDGVVGVIMALGLKMQRASDGGGGSGCGAF